MNCSDFQKNLDLYLDAELEDSVKRSAALHVTSCRTCDAVVIQHQKARALLITAVTDRVAAVDVSGIWSAVEACLDPSPVGIISLTAARARLRNRRSIAGFTPLRAGALAAAAAAAIFAFTLFGADAPSSSADSSATVARSRPLFDSMEVAAGHSVSTWVKPRTRTRVIWVANTSGSDGYGVSNASHSR